MAKSVPRSIRLVLVESRRALGMSQRAFGYAVGSSHRSAVRWDAGTSIPGAHSLRVLAKLLYPHDRSLAIEVAAAANETLDSLGLEMPFPASLVSEAPSPAPAPPLPVRPEVRPEDLVDVVVLAAIEHSGMTAPMARASLHAVFKRGLDLGLTMEAAERALRPSGKRGTKVEG